MWLREIYQTKSLVILLQSFLKACQQSVKKHTFSLRPMNISTCKLQRFGVCMRHAGDFSENVQNIIWLNAFRSSVSLTVLSSCSTPSPGLLSKPKDNQQFIAAGNERRKQMLVWLNTHLRTHASSRASGARCHFKGCQEQRANILSPGSIYLWSMWCREDQLPTDWILYYLRQRSSCFQPHWFVCLSVSRIN